MSKINQEIKNKILDDIKANSLSVAQASKKWKVSPKTIYNWQDEVSSPSKIKSLKKENRELKADCKAYIKLIRQLSVSLKKKN